MTSGVVDLSPTFGWAASQVAHKALHAAVEQQTAEHVVIDGSAVERAYPNGIVPLIVEVEHLRLERGTRFDLKLPSHPSCRASFESLNWAAHLVPDQGFAVNDRASSLHRFVDDGSLNDLINRQIREVLGKALYAAGVMQSFEWALNEIAGNVLVHSGAGGGWMQVQVHPSTHHMAIVVADGGLGIPDTIRQAFPEKPLRDEDAIAFSLQEGITSRPDFGQGKGLTGTLEIVKKNVGARMAIHSREGVVEWKDDRLAIKRDFPPFRGTLIDIQLDTQQPIDIEKALWGSAPVFPFNEALYGKDLPIGVMRYELGKSASGFGNRVTGQRIRIEVENLLTAAPSDVLEIDFTGVELIASSFADEVFGKLAVSLGFVGFASRLRLVNLNKFCRGIIDDVVRSRIVQSYGGNGHAQ